MNNKIIFPYSAISLESVPPPQIFQKLYLSYSYATPTVLNVLIFFYHDFVYLDHLTNESLIAMKKSCYCYSTVSLSSVIWLWRNDANFISKAVVFFQNSVSSYSVMTYYNIVTPQRRQLVCNIQLSLSFVLRICF